jgi:hypothetical protein
MKNFWVGVKRFAYAVWSFVFYINPNDTARMAAWRAQDIQEMQNAPGLDPNAVGKLIGAGMQHRIYEYHQEMAMVLKVSTPIPFLRFPSYDDARTDVECIARYLAPYQIQPTEVIPLRGGRYVIAQRRLEHLDTLTPELLADASLRAQFLDVVERNCRMRREVGRALDFLGREGQRKCRAALLGLRATPTIANVVVETQRDGARQLRILDTDLENFFPHATSPRERQSALAARMAVAFNRFFIRRFFGIDIGVA